MARVARRLFPLLFAGLLVTAAADVARAKPQGRSGISNCFSCHDNVRSAADIGGFSRIANLGAGSLPTFTASPGDSVAVTINVSGSNGDKYAVAVMDLDNPGLGGGSLDYTVNQGSTWSYAGSGTYNHYYTSATSTERPYTFNLTVGASADPDVYVIESQVASKNSGWWADVDHFYLEILAANADPTADAGGPYGKAGWTGPGGWNNPQREIMLDASGSSDADSDPLLYTWRITNTYDPAHPVTVISTGLADTYAMAVSELLGLLPPTLTDAEANLFSVTVTVDDQNGGVVASSPTSLFVPEPASMALLGLASAAWLCRRRRR